MKEIITTYQKIFDSNQKYDGALVKVYVEKFKELNQYLPPLDSFILITNTSTNSYEFIGDNFEKCLGLDRSKMLSEGLKYYLGFYHPEDLPILLQIFEELMHFTMSELSPEQRKSVVYTWRYRIRNAHGVYKNMHVQQNPIFFDEQNRPVIGYSHNTIIGEGEPLPLIATCKILNDQNEFETVFQKNYNKERFQYSLTNREADIVRLIASSNSSNEIAAKLNISPHTVSVHRKKILEKLNLKSSVEIVEYCNKYHLY